MSKQFTFEAIGTHFWIEIFDDITEMELEATKGRLELLSSDFNLQYSRFRSDSQISTLNRERKIENPSEECRKILTYGKNLYLRSHGTFNLLTGHILEARGYDANYTFKATDGADVKSVCNPLTDLTISETEITLTCGSIDIGGYGKGWLIDMMKDDLLACGIEHFLINGGGDMYATSDQNGEAVAIYLEHPTITSQYLMETKLLNQGFAASSPFKRQWSDKGTSYTHIVSDKEVPLLAAFTKAMTATEADAFATPCGLLTEAELIVLGKSESVSFARFNPATNEFWQTTDFDNI